MNRRSVFGLMTSTMVGAFLLVSASIASAQTTVTAPSSGNKQVVSANPFLTMFEWFNLEYSRRHTESTTWGASASRFGIDGVSYGNVTALYRYYPGGKALNGFYIGGRGGVHRVGVEGASASAFGAGFELGYDWLLGRRKNFAVGIGAGATRLFGGDVDGARVIIPTVRLVNIGWSF